MADGYTGQTAPSGSSGYDGANHAGSSSSSSRSTAAAGGNNTSAISAGSGGFLPTAASGPTMGSSLSPAAAQTFNGGGTSVQHGNQTGAAVGATRQAAANAGLSASDRTSDGQQRRSGAAAAGESLSSPGLHADVAAQIVQEEREAAEKMPVYEGLEERFVLLSKMGDGAFSNVYKARDKKTGQKVAIKVVRKYELNSNQVSIRFSFLPFSLSFPSPLLAPVSSFRFFFFLPSTGRRKAFRLVALPCTSSLPPIYFDPERTDTNRWVTAPPPQRREVGKQVERSAAADHRPLPGHSASTPFLFQSFQLQIETPAPLLTALGPFPPSSFPPLLPFDFLPLRHLHRLRHFRLPYRALAFHRSHRRRSGLSPFFLFLFFFLSSFLSLSWWL